MADAANTPVAQAAIPSGPSPVSRVVTALRRGDIALALGVTCILVVLILPMPRWLLDGALAISITFSVLIMMVALFISRPLDFSSFPTVLLIATIMRLALNLASTRLILSNGHEGPGAAGQVIQAFGNFVMGGNFVIGLIVFAILILVNFIVITKGSGRIAEVTARFSLDAMPGKQMAIDADLSAGLIDEDEARSRRKSLEDESTFFGSMDGAAKFVRGDAIAGLIITFINIVAGIIIGVAQKDLSLGDAAQSYTILTVGDGLVSQIPALIVSHGGRPSGLQIRHRRLDRQGAVLPARRLSAGIGRQCLADGRTGAAARHSDDPVHSAGWSDGRRCLPAQPTPGAGGDR